MCGLFGRVAVVIRDGESKNAGSRVGRFMRLMELWGVILRKSFVAVKC